MRNEDLRTELEYYSEEYDEEREMEPRLHTDGSRVERESEEAISLQITQEGISLLKAPVSNHDPILNGSTYPSNTLPNSYPFYTQPINLLSNAPIYPSYGPTGLFTDFTRCVTPFVHGIEDYPLPDGLKMPSHVGSYDGKGDLDNYLYLFKGDIHLPTTYKVLMEKTHTWIIAKEVATNEALNFHQEGFDRFNKGSSWENNKGRKKDKDMFSPYKGSNHRLLSNLSKSPREILLRHQIEEAIRSGQLAHLVKGIKKGKEKALDTQLVEGKKREKDIVPTNAPILMISEHSWPLKEVPLEVMIGENPYTRIKTLNFVIVRSDSPHNLLLKRTAMQRMGIVVSIIHVAIKFHTPTKLARYPHPTNLTKLKKDRRRIRKPSRKLRGMYSVV
ncbi:hypothetical protein Tco_0923620 [Tanacetum coccineum]|uniref:Uncharacterized protein n=1 Tax=Tanacetum coccineum TaxID=301880 RepID=A0ABQ5D1H2_9ASTR